MPQIVFQQGEDYKVSVNITKDAVPVDCSGASDIRVSLGQQVGTTTTVLQKYAQTNQSGYGTCEVNATINSQIDIFVERSQSKTFPTGNFSVNVLVQFPDATQPSGFRHEEFNFPNIGRINKGETTDEPIP